MYLEIQADACQGGGAGHGVSGVDFVALGKGVLASCPEVKPAGGVELGAKVPEHCIFRGGATASVGGDGGVEAAEVLNAGGD